MGKECLGGCPFLGILYHVGATVCHKLAVADGRQLSFDNTDIRYRSLNSYIACFSPLFIYFFLSS